MDDKVINFMNKNELFCLSDGNRVYFHLNKYKKGKHDDGIGGRVIRTWRNIPWWLRFFRWVMGWFTKIEPIYELTDTRWWDGTPYEVMYEDEKFSEMFEHGFLKDNGIQVLTVDKNGVAFFDHSYL